MSGLHRLGRGGDAADQPAAADRHHQHIEVRRRRPASPAPASLGPRSPPRRRTDGRKSSPLRPASCQACRAASSTPSPSSTTARAEPARVLDLHERRVLAASRWWPGCPAAARGRPRPARGCRPTSRPRPRAACAGVELRQPVQRTALLERGGVLQVLELQPELGAGDLRQGARRQAGRAGDLARQPLAVLPATSSRVTVTGTAAAGPGPAARRAPASGSCSGSPGRRRP